MLGTAQRVHGEQQKGLVGVAKIVSSSTYSMKPTDHLVWCDASDNTVDITLPDKAEAAGGFYCIVAIDVSNDVSVIEKENATEITTTGDLDTQYDTTMYYSTGLHWISVTTAIT